MLIDISLVYLADVSSINSCVNLIDLKKHLIRISVNI